MKNDHRRIIILVIISLLFIQIYTLCDTYAQGTSAYDKALKMYRDGDFRGAIKVLRKKGTIDAGEANLLGWAYLKSGDVDEAIRQFKKSLKLSPSSLDSYCGLGFSYFRTERIHDALESFEKGTSGNSRDIDCLLGKAGVLERLNETDKAIDVYKQILKIDKDNKTALAKAAVETHKSEGIAKEDIEFFARGDYFWIRINDKVKPLFIKGVNLGFGLPGKYPTEFPSDIDAYLEWFRMIREMNANVIRVYTILPPQFYRALRIFNENRKGEDNLFLIQGIWVELPEGDDFSNAGFRDEVRQEIKNAVDVIHGNASISHRYGHAHGVYRDDISSYVAGFIFGREWEPYVVQSYNKMGRSDGYKGGYLSISDSTPMEQWFTEMLDHLISYEDGKYNGTRPAALMNWPPLDPIYHESEATLSEETELRRKSGENVGVADYSHAFDEDAVVIDENKIRMSMKFRSGLFASYHVYPYYPDFLRNDERYGMDAPVEGARYYYNYLTELKTFYSGMPLLISEFGVPTSRGIARYHPEGMNHGGHNEEEQGVMLQRLFEAIRKSGAAGGVAFAWADEWFKSNWMVKGMEEDGRLWYNAQDPEESYGIIAMNPAGKDKLRGMPGAWGRSEMLYSDDSPLPVNVLRDNSDGARNIRRVYADSDAGYFYLRIDVDGKPDWSKVAYLIAIDTIGDEEGDHIIPYNLGIESQVGFEFVVLLHGNNSAILIDDSYNRMVLDQSLEKLPGMSGYRFKRDFRPVSNRNGLYEPVITTHRRRFSRSGKVFPERVYNSSILTFGNSAENSIADYFYSDVGRFIEIRIPWNLLYFVNPAERKILYSQNENRSTDGIRLMAYSYRPNGIGDSTAMRLSDGTNATDMLPKSAAGMKSYIWKGWDMPEYVARPKSSYNALKLTYGEADSPVLKVKPPQDFEFSPVVQNHYDSLGDFLRIYGTDISVDGDTYGMALASLVKGLVDVNPFYIMEANSLFSASLEGRYTTGLEKEASRSGMAYTDRLLTGIFDAAGNRKDKLERIDIKKYPAVKKDFTKIMLGRTAIKVKQGATIATQADRVTRDWLSGANYGSAPWSFDKEEVVRWHEGEKVREIIDLTGANVHPVWGTVVSKFGNNWYAPDADGIYRFEVSSDKVYNYPTNIIIDNEHVLLNDTHGISAIAWDSVGTDLAIGCGDYIGKVEAAYYLAGMGLDVYMPTDRFLSKLIGTRTKGKIIGSAPVKKYKDGAIIGDQPLAFDINEKIVVSNASGGYPIQYYDTPYTYFKELEKYSGKELMIIPVDVREYGKSSSVVDEAKRIGSKLIGIRVAVKEEHDAVASWLSEDKGNRAVLFHTAVYPDGYRLFYEFPEQTSFGDINVEFE